jgi:hypothetical protein
VTRLARALALGGLLALAGALAPASAAAQELTGIAVGPDGEALVDQTVVLHRVGGGGDALIGTDTTNADGAFRFVLEPADSGVYFAAMRYEGRIYIGPAAQAGGDPVTGYILRVSASAEAGAVASALSGRAPTPAPAQPAARRSDGGSETGAFLLVGLLALAAVGIFVVAAPRYRHRRTLDGVIELASVENALEDAVDEDERQRLRTTRDRLREQLAPRS